MTPDAEIARAAAAERLSVLGGFAPDGTEAGLPGGCRTVLLFGPTEPGFWPHVAHSPEFGSDQPDPLDRWSRRVLGGLAERVDAMAIFPSDGPPYPPFFDWALRCGTFWPSPIQMLVHHTAGLMISLRGALALPVDVPVPPPAIAPCINCDTRPCATACPVSAFESGNYAVRACHNHLDTSAGSDCMGHGCAARRACPVSQTSGRLPEQSAFHMRAFHGSQCDN